jgi:hypothetical protein
VIGRRLCNRDQLARAKMQKRRSGHAGGHAVCVRRGGRCAHHLLRVSVFAMPIIIKVLSEMAKSLLKKRTYFHYKM